MSDIPWDELPIADSVYKYIKAPWSDPSTDVLADVREFADAARRALPRSNGAGVKGMRPQRVVIDEARTFTFTPHSGGPPVDLTPYLAKVLPRARSIEPPSLLNLCMDWRDSL